MVGLLARIFIRNFSDYGDADVRRGYGILCGAIGVAINVALCVFKFVFGVAASSVAMVADAFNNLTDAASSVVQMAGFKMASKGPDGRHPYGHGRMEYVAGLVISFLIVYVGVELVRKSVSSFSSPREVAFSVSSGAVMAVSMAAKLYMFIFNRRVHVRPRTPQSIHSQGLASIDTCLIPEPWRAGQAQSSTGTAEEPASGCRKRAGAAGLASQGRGCAWPLAPTAQTAGSHGPGGALTYSELLPEDGLLAEGGAVPAPEAELVLALVDAHLRPLPNHDDGIGPALTDGALPRGQARNLVADDVGSQGHDG